MSYEMHEIESHTRSHFIQNFTLAESMKKIRLLVLISYVMNRLLAFNLKVKKQSFTVEAYSNEFRK